MNRQMIPSQEGMTLSAEELRVVAAYRTMDDRRRRENLDLMEDDAASHPARRAPALRLIAGGGA